MEFQITLLMVISTLLGTQARNLDPGPQVLNNTSKLSPQTSQKRYATKEIILYLTPSQIRALHEGQGWVNPQQISNENDRDANALSSYQAQQSAVQREQDNRLNQRLVQPNPLKAAPVEEPQSDDFLPIGPPPEYRHSNNYAYINFYPPNNPDTPRFAPIIPEPKEQGLSAYKESSTLSPQEILPEKNPEENQKRDHLKEQWYRLLDQNRANLNAHVALTHYQEQKSNEQKKDTQNAAKYSDQKFALDVEQLINHHHQLQLEKQNALIRAEAIANSPPLVIHKEINIKHSPVHLIKQVKVPVPTPVFIPIPEPFEVKVPHPYPVPLEIIKQVPVDSQKRFSLPENKNYFQPYFLERAIPFDTSEHKTGNLPSNRQL